MTAIRPIGTYVAEVAEAERQWITANVTRDPDATNKELAGLTLLELEVNDTGDFDVGEIHQDGSGQVPWLEKYFSANGHEFIGEQKPPISHYRVCFYLHGLDPDKDLVSPYGTIVLGPSGEIPERLREVCIYEHPG